MASQLIIYKSEKEPRDKRSFIWIHRDENDCLTAEVYENEWKQLFVPEYDSEPTEGSKHYVTSDALKALFDSIVTDLSGKQDIDSDAVEGNLAVFDASGNTIDAGIAPSDKQDTLTFDTTPTSGSTNPVTSDGIYEALADKQDVLTAGDGIDITDSTVSSTTWVNGGSVGAIKMSSAEDSVGYCSVAEGLATVADGEASHAEGSETTASGNYSHAEGGSTTASGGYAHAEGNGTVASGYNAHAEGYDSVASGLSSHAECENTKATGDYSHAEGQDSTASGKWAHAEGNSSVASGDGSHAEGNSTASGDYSHSEGLSEATGDYSHAEGEGCVSEGLRSHAEGNSTLSSGDYSHAEGTDSAASGIGSHAEGFSTIASGAYSHAEGQDTIASNHTSHSEGEGTEASGYWAHAEGSSTTSSAYASHAEGYESVASGDGAHAEGGSHTLDAWGGKATGNGSHAEGSETTASGDFSHAEGDGTTASNRSEHAQGQHNVSNKTSSTFGDAGNTIHSIGIGTSSTNCKNAFEVMQNGDVYVYGAGSYDGTNPISGTNDLVTLLSSTSSSSSAKAQIVTPTTTSTTASSSTDMIFSFANGRPVLRIDSTTEAGENTYTTTEFYESYVQSIGAEATATDDASRITELVMYMHEYQMPIILNSDDSSNCMSVLATYDESAYYPEGTFIFSYANTSYIVYASISGSVATVTFAINAVA